MYHFDVIALLFYDIDMTECVPDPCKNKGTCKSEGNTFVCTCQPGYSGATCGKGELIPTFISFNKILVSNGRKY
jgi:hypothetical protein